MRFKPSLIAIAYFGTILVFAFLYYIFQDQFKNLATPLDSFYFSVVTITTLGYGDILPIDRLGKALVSAQALLGVSALGFLFVSIGQSIAEESTERHKRASKHNFRIQYKSFREYISNNIIGFLPDDLIGELPPTSEPDWREFYNDRGLQEPLFRNCAELLLTKRNFYRNTILHLRILQQSLDSFIQRVVVEDASTLEKLSTYQSKLQSIQGLEVKTEDQRNEVAILVYDIFSKLEAFNGEDYKDELLNLLDAC